jgi:hypothetical protein
MEISGRQIHIVKVGSYGLTFYLPIVKAKFINVLFFVLVVHLIVSLLFIVESPVFGITRFSRVYKTHFLPGPFFTASRIIDNYSLAISWMINGTWSPVINPAKEDFNRYHKTLNPSDLYRSRISRTLYLRLTLPDSSVTDIENRKEFTPLKEFLYDHYVPMEADSVRIWIINKQVENFRIKADSVYITFPR